jgi:hypothetical protein
MNCTYTYKGKKYSRDESLRIMSARFMRTIKERVTASGILTGPLVVATGDEPELTPVLKSLVSTLSQKFKLKANIISSTKAFELLGQNYEKGVKSFVKGSNVYLVEDKFTASDTIEEFLHPFIMAIYRKNNPLFKSLLNEIPSDISTVVDQYYTNEGGFSDTDRSIEKVTKTLTRLLARDPSDITNIQESWVTRALNYIVRVLESVFGKKFGAFKVYADLLPVTISMGQLAELVKDPTKTFETVKDSGTWYSLSINQEELIKQMTNILSSKDVIDANIDKFSNLVSTQSYRITRNKGFSELRELLKNPDGSLKSTDIDLLLRTASTKGDTPSDLSFKIRQIVNTLLYAKVSTDSMLELSRNLATNSQLDPRDHISSIKYMLQFAFDWKNLISEFRVEYPSSNDSEIKLLLDTIQGNITEIEDISFQADKSGVLQVLEQQLLDVKNNVTDYYSKEIAKLNDLIKKGKNVKENTRLLKSRQADLEKFRLDRDLILKYLKGENGDTNYFSGLLEAYMSSPDPIIAGFSKFIESSLLDSDAYLQAKQQKMLNELDPLYKEAGIDRSNTKQLFDIITYEEDVLSINPMTGVLEAGKVRKYMSKFKGYEFKFAQDIEKIETFKREGRMAEYYDALYQYEYDQTTHMHREYVPEYYRAKQIFSTVIGKRAVAARQVILDEIRDINYRINLTAEPSQEDLEALEYQWNLYRKLHSRKGPDGKDKSGDELEIAEALIAYKEATKEFYETVEIPGAFERAKTIYREAKLAEGLSPEEVDQLALKWEENNTRVVLSQDFYDQRKIYTDTISELMSKINNSGQRKESLSDIWNKIFEQVSGYRDEDGQPNALEMNPLKIREIKELEEELERIKALFEGANNLTKAENMRRAELFDLAYEGTITDEERDELTQLTLKSTNQGLTPAERAELYNAIESLTKLQSSAPTDYYVDTLNDLLLPHGLSVNLGSALKFINSADFARLRLADPNIARFVKDNHITKSYYSRAERDTVTELVPTYSWRIIVPNNPRHYTRVPAYKFMKKQIKSEYRTEKKVGVNVDNKGNWLPLDTPNSPFLNPAYEELSRTKPQYAKILDVVVKYHLEAQEELGRQHRLGYEVPRVRRTRLEGVRSQSFKGYITNKTKQLFKKQQDDYSEDLGNYNSDNDANPVKYVSTDLVGNEVVMAPMKYTAKIPLDDLSYDVVGSTLKYMQAAEYNKKLVEINPFALALKNVLSRYGVRDLTKASKGQKVKKGINVFVKKRSDTYNRLSIVENIIESTFEGVTNKMELGEIGNRTSNILMQLASFSSLAFNLPSAAKNLFSAQVQNFLEGVYGDFVNTKDLLRGNMLFFRMAGNLIDDNYKLGKKGLDTQMLQLFDPVQGTFESTFGRATSASKTEDLIEAKFAYAPREFGELEAQASLFLGAMSRIRVSRTMPDGTVTEIPYNEAFELDAGGVIALKQGVDPSYGAGGQKFKDFKMKLHEVNRRLQGNYAKRTRTEIERYSSGRLLVFLRKYLVPAFVRRFSYNRVNVPMGTTVEGYYITGARFIKMLYNARDPRIWNSLSDVEKGNVLRLGSEIMTSIMFGSLLLLLGFDDDDEDRYKKLEQNGWLYNHIIYQVMMIKSESEQFIPIPGMGFNELVRIKNTPSIAFGQMDKYVVLINDMLDVIASPFSDKDETHFSRRTGYWEKGDSKMFAHFVRLFGFTGSSIDPISGIRNFELMTTRNK